MAEPHERISISRDSLRAELAELELRLVDKLASRSELEKLAARVVILESSALKRNDIEFRMFHDMVEQLSKRALTAGDVDAAIADALQSKEARGWTNRERWFGVILFGITVATFALQVWRG